MILGFFLVRPIPLPDEYHGVQDSYGVTNNSRTHLLDPIQGENLHSSYTVYNNDRDNSQESKPIADLALLRNLGNRKVLCSGDFWLLATMVTLRMCFFFLISWIICTVYSN
jgi:hypothetical protein